MAGKSALTLQQHGLGLRQAAPFTSYAPPSSCGDDFFGALDASTRGFWPVYDSSGLLARAGLLNHKIGSAARPSTGQRAI